MFDKIQIKNLIDLKKSEINLSQEEKVKKINDLVKFMEIHDEIADYHHGFSRSNSTLETTFGQTKKENNENFSKDQIKKSIKDSRPYILLNGSIYGGNSASTHGILSHISKFLDPEFKDLFSETEIFNELASNAKFEEKSKINIIFDTISEIGKTLER